MAVQNLSALAGVVTSDATAGSTAASVINNHIAAMAPGDVLVWDCPVSPNGQINVASKLGIRITGAGPMGSRLSPSGNNNGLVATGLESCVIENIGIAPKSVQTAGVGLTYDVDPVGSVIPVGHIFRNIDIFDRPAHAGAWGLGTGRPYKGVHLKGGTGGYNSLFDAVRVNGAVSDGWTIGTYHQSARGSVGTHIKRCMAARCGGNGYAVFAAEALLLAENTEALQNQGNGLLTYPDNGGFVELLLVDASFDTNWGHGVEVNAGGAGAGGHIKFLDVRESWFGNNGNPAMRPAGDNGSWNSACGLVVSAAVSKVWRAMLLDNNAAVNGATGFQVCASDILHISGNRAMSNGQAGLNSGNGINALDLPAENYLCNNFADGQGYNGVYPARQATGIATTGSNPPVGHGNVSLNPNGLGTPFAWHASPKSYGSSYNFT